MNVQLTKLFDDLAPWKVQTISRLPDNGGVEVAFSANGANAVRFQTMEFDVGRRGAKAAALAKFAASAGFGDVEAIYRFVSGLPRDMTGIILAEGEPVDLENVAAI